MPLVVVTGLPGVGKSSVYEHLRQQGREAYGSDEDGFLIWKDKVTRLPAPDPEDWRDAEATRGLYARVSRDRVEALRLEAGDRTVYLCGCAGHEVAFLDLIDHLVCIVTDDDTLRYRLRTRTNNNYGKDPQELASILKASATWEADYRGHGATIIDGTPPIDQVVAEILHAVEGPEPGP